MAVAEPAEGGTGRKKLYFLPQMDIVILKICFIEINLGMGRDILAPLLVLSHKYLSRQTQAYICRDKRRVFCVLTALCNILQHFLSFTNITHIIMTTNNV